MKAADSLEKRLRKWGYAVESTSFHEIDVVELTVDGGPFYVQVNDEGDGRASYLLWRFPEDKDRDESEHSLIGSYLTQEQLLAALRHHKPVKEEAH